MQFLVRLAISMTVIVFCALIGKERTSLAGLIATMPLTSLIVLVWLYSDDPANHDLMVGYTRAALWGILPSILFFIVAYYCFRKHMPFRIAVPAGFGVWLIGASVHQWLLG